MGEVYDNSNRAFLQAFLARSVLTFEDAKVILAAILTAHEDRQTLENDITEADFNNYVSAANTALSALDFEIRSTLSQHDRTRVWALVNTASDELTQLATTHSADEIAYVKRVLDAMFETNNTQRAEICAVRGNDALRLAKGSADRRETQGSSGQGLTMKDAERVLKGMVEEGWFERSRAGWYSLSPRALMELRGWLVETYNEPPTEEGDEGVERVKLCQACREIVTVGQRCADNTCSFRLHNICTQSFFRTLPAKKCPKCETNWTGQSFVGEKAAGGRGSNVGTSSRRTTRNEDEEDESDD
ncbi:DNA repair protein Nse1 [Patellaria atrata CBS 101060]|uniref:Non-structural maintenance of chromosomes element 1 homolog n=1 Tax=Patellaria atrata CBS 101060 TaxID=1346257 RepID=A0A9P4S2G4_9PEZI|nr:DNA repair protein Nse1 [Patellaria atrata CBS 101060]